jgi:hypothetical protein
MRKREKLGSPEEESTASSSTESASGLGGGTPEGRPARGRDMPREQEGADAEPPRESGEGDSHPPEI